MRTREDSIAWTMRYCQHYDPSGVTMIGGKEPHGHCKAGVNYHQQFPNPDKTQPEYYGIFIRLCCTSGGKRTETEQLASCPKWLRSTREQGEKQHDEIEASMARMRVVMPVVGEWRKKKPFGKQEIIECPACKGKLHLSQASYNGHVHGQCETEGCVSWME